MRNAPDRLRRRSFLSRLTAGAAAAGLISTDLGAAAQTDSFHPARHQEDDWLDAIPGRHRFVLDALTAAGADDARQFASNYFIANQTGYALKAQDLAVVIILRHWATAFAFNDAMWEKHGAAIAKIVNFKDPATREAPRVNVYAHSGITWPTLIRQGVHFAVCGMAMRFFAGEIAAAGGPNADAVYDELNGNLIPNSHAVAAGVVAVNRSQERGYTYGYVG